MATTTPKLGLTKPANTDAYDIGIQNENMNKLDEAVTLTDTQTMTNKTLTSPKVGTAILDTNGNEVIKTPATANAVNEVTVTNNVSGSNPSINASGDNTNIGLDISSKGTGPLRFFTGSAMQFVINGVANAVNQVFFYGSTTGNGVSIGANGTDTNIDINITPKGTGKVNLTRASGTMTNLIETAGGTATAITLASAPLITGASASFICNASNAGAATTINGKNLFINGTITTPKLVAGGVYEIYYNGTVFYLTDNSTSSSYLGQVIDLLEEKTTPVDADTVAIRDSAALQNVAKKVSWLNIKATLKTYFDTLYTKKLWEYLGLASTTTATKLTTVNSNLYSEFLVLVRQAGTNRVLASINIPISELLDSTAANTHMVTSAYSPTTYQGQFYYNSTDKCIYGFVADATNTRLVIKAR